MDKKVALTMLMLLLLITAASACVGWAPTWYPPAFATSSTFVPRVNVQPVVLPRVPPADSTANIYAFNTSAC